MDDQERINAIAVKMTKRFRFVGWWLLIIGCIVCVEPVAALFDPHATIPVNGVPTADFTTKLGATAFVLIFPLVGGFFAFTPRKKLEAGFAAFIRWAQAFAAQPLARSPA